MKIFFSVIVVGVLIVGALGGGLMWLRSGAGPVLPPSSVRVETVTRGDLMEIVQAPAEVQPRNKVSISARVAARIVEIPSLEGTRVKKGDLLVKLDSTDLQATLRSAEARRDGQLAGLKVAEARLSGQKAQLIGTEATLVEAERDLERQKGLLSSRDVSQSTVDTAQRRVDELKASYEAAKFNLVGEETNLIVLRHNLQAAEAEIDKAEDNLSYTTIVSPIDGIITTINAKVGELVVTGTMNNAGTVIMEVADLSQMLAQARVDETDIASVAVGQPAKVHLLAYPDEVFPGTVTTVALARSTDRTNTGGGGDAKAFKVEVLLDVQNRRIHSGLTADVEIETRTNKDVLRVPSQAVMGRPVDGLPAAIRANNPNVDTSKTVAMVVYRFVGGKAIVTPVSVGAADNIYTMIRGGLSDGDEVISGPYKVLETLAHEQVVIKETGPTTLPATQPSAPTPTSNLNLTSRN